MSLPDRESSLVGRPSQADSGVSCDGLLAKQIVIFQPKTGYRFNLDAVLLAHFAGVKTRAKVLDLGCGTGVVSFLLLARFGADIVRLHGLDVDRKAIALAQKNRQANAWIATRDVDFLVHDWHQRPKAGLPLPYDVVVSNPPWFAAGRGRASPHAKRQASRQCQDQDLQAWASFVRSVLKNKGSLFVVFSAARINALLQVMAKVNLEPKTLRFVHDRPGQAAKSVLVQAVAAGGPGCQVASALYVRQRDGAYTDEIKTMLGEGVSCKPDG